MWYALSHTFSIRYIIIIDKGRIPFCLTGGGSGRVHERSERKTIVLRPGEGVAKKTGALGARTLERGGDFPRL